MRRASSVKRRKAIAAAGAALWVASVALAQAPRVVVPVTMIDRIPHVTAAIVFGETDEAEGTGCYRSSIHVS